MNAPIKRSLWKLHPKRIDIILLITLSASLLFMGLKLPVLTMRQLWTSNSYSILSGIQSLWAEKYYALAGLIFFFSILFPIVKLGALAVVWCVRLTDAQRKWILYCLSFLGKWSMLDVFITAILIVWVRMGPFSNTKAEPGIYFFAASILLAMLVTSFENYIAKPFRINQK